MIKNILIKYIELIKKKSKILFNIISIYIVLILFINLIIFVWTIYGPSFSVLVGDSVYVFDHGYNSSYEETSGHIMYLGGEPRYTIQYLYELEYLNYTRVWGTWCFQGGEDVIYKEENKSISWPEYVDRVEEPGILMLYFNGFNLVRCPIPKFLESVVS